MGLAVTEQGGPKDIGSERALKYREDLEEKRRRGETQRKKETLRKDTTEPNNKPQNTPKSPWESQAKRTNEKAREDGRRGNKEIRKS